MALPGGLCLWDPEAVGGPCRWSGLGVLGSDFRVLLSRKFYYLQGFARILVKTMGLGPQHLPGTLLMGLTPESQGQALGSARWWVLSLGWVLSSSQADLGKGAAAYTQTRSQKLCPSVDLLKLGMGRAALPRHPVGGSEGCAGHDGTNLQSRSCRYPQSLRRNLCVDLVPSSQTCSWHRVGHIK